MNLLALAELDPTLDRVAAGVVKRVLARVQKARAYKHVHAAADAQLPVVQALMNAAFARGHAAVSREQLVKLITKEDHGGLIIAVDMAITATANALHESDLHEVLLKTLVDSGKTAFNHVKVAAAEQPRDDHGRWTGANFSAGQKKAALDKLAKTEPGEKLITNPLKAGKDDGSQGTVTKELVDRAPIKDVKISDIHSVQDTVTREGVEHAIKNPTGKGRNQGEDYSTKVPVLVQDEKGKYFVHDGNHRIVGRKLLGQTSVPVKVVQWKDAVKAHKMRGAADPSISTDFVFDDTDPNAVEWAKQHAAELVQGISKTSRDDIRQLVEDAFTEHLTADELADEIENVIGDDARAETIARTETMKASNVGQKQAWDQAVEQGLLLGTEQQEWITTPDDKLCPICESLDGQTVGLDESFSDDSGDEYDGPPAHPNCRCTVGLTLEPATAMRAAAYSDDEPRDDHGKWTGGGSGSTSARAQRALASHKPSTAAVQRHAESNETDVKKMVGGDTTGDNEAMDVVTKIDGKKHGVEVKTLIHNSNDKITMHPPSRRRKEQWSKDNHAVVHTVVLDDRKGRANSGHRIYYKRGVGAFRLHTMTPVKNAAHLRDLMRAK